VEQDSTAAVRYRSGLRSREQFLLLQPKRELDLRCARRALRAELRRPRERLLVRERVVRGELLVRAVAPDCDRRVAAVSARGFGGKRSERDAERRRIKRALHRERRVLLPRRLVQQSRSIVHCRNNAAIQGLRRELHRNRRVRSRGFAFADPFVSRLNGLERRASKFSLEEKPRFLKRRQPFFTRFNRQKVFCIEVSSSSNRLSFVCVSARVRLR